MEIIHLVFDKSDAIGKKLTATVDLLASAQVKLGYNVKLWELSTKHKDEFQNRLYKTILFHLKLFQWSITKEINKAISELGKDTILHLHGGFIPVFFTLAFKLNKYNIPFVYTLHGTFNKENIEASGLSKKVYFRMFESGLMNWCAALHFEGPGEKALIADPSITNHRKVVYIPNGISNESRLPPAKYNEAEEPVLGYFGKLDIKNDGLDILLKAFAEYKQHYAGKGILWIVGEGSGKKQLYAFAAKMGIQNSVFFKGNVIGLRKFELLNKVNVLVKPSRYEYDTAIILEAASSSVPAIVSKETNMGEYISEYDAGYVLTENTPQQLSKALHNWSMEMESYQWEQKRRTAVKMINERFHWSIIAKEHMKVYERILAEWPLHKA
jgi:glycosyltransferase involved in cell wall biosynthesis